MLNFICPKCKCDLTKNGNIYSCENNHCFDISKEGYVNLLMSQQTSQKRHGDDKLMVRSRRDFLNKGFYEKLCSCICEEAYEILPSKADIVDVGCGEGYYTKALSNCKDFNIFGIDISKDALKYASKLMKESEFAVASAFNLPFENESADCIVNVFAPSAYEEFHRVLKNDGVLIKAVPLENHLWELKCALYKEPYKNKPEKRNDELFKLCSVREVNYTEKLKSNEDIMNLFRMTPYYYKTGREETARLSHLQELEVSFNFGVEIYKKINLF